ncbi:MAG: Ig-like domain-containing protein, partial [Methanomassiliicoccales archaeon]
MKIHRLWLLSLLTLFFIGIPCLVARADYTTNSVSFNGTSYSAAALATSPITLPLTNASQVNVLVSLSGSPDANCDYWLDLALGSSEFRTSVTGPSISFSIPLPSGNQTGSLILDKFDHTTTNILTQSEITFDLVIPSVDTTSPTVSTTTPVAGSSSVAIADNIVVSCSENIKLPTDTNTAFTLRNGSGTSIPA